MNLRGIAGTAIVLIVAGAILVPTLIIGAVFFNHDDPEPNTPSTLSIPSNRTVVVIDWDTFEINESFVRYFLYSIGAQDLHNPPFSSNTPKMNMFVGEKAFTAEVIDKSIRVVAGSAPNADITIRTSEEEARKMIKDRSYVIISFQEGKSSLEMNAGQTTLVAKGYLTLYNRLT